VKPTHRKHWHSRTEDGPGTSQWKQAPRLECLPAEDGPLSHRTVPPVDKELKCWWSTSSRIVSSRSASRISCGVEVRKETGRGQDRFQIRGIFAEEQCSQTPKMKCQWGLGGERADERRLEAEELGAEVEERLQFFPTPSFLDSAEEV